MGRGHLSPRPTPIGTSILEPTALNLVASSLAPVCESCDPPLIGSYAIDPISSDDLE